MKKIKKLLLLFVFTLSMIALPVQASILNPEATGKINQNAQMVSEDAGYGSADVVSIVKTVIVTVLGLLAIIFICLMVYSGFKWMTAAGDPEPIKKAKETIISSIIGLVIVLASYAITYFIFTSLPFQGTAPQGTSYIQNPGS
jgi:hypothetical protein